MAAASSAASSAGADRGQTTPTRLSSLPHEVLAAIMLRAECPQALVLCCKDASNAWPLARDAWARGRAFKRACAANDAGAAAALLALGWPGAGAAAAAALARLARLGGGALFSAVLAWAAEAQPALLAPPSGANGPLIVAAAAGRRGVCQAVALALDGLLPSAAACGATAAAAADSASGGVERRQVQAQLDGALCVAAAGGHTAIMTDLLARGARISGAGAGAPGALHAAVTHRQAAAVALLATQRPADGGPTPEQAAAAAELAAAAGHACCLAALADSGLLGAPALRTALLAAARAEQRDCAAVTLAALRRSAAAATAVAAARLASPQQWPPEAAALRAAAADGSGDGDVFVTVTIIRPSSCSGAGRQQQKQQPLQHQPQGAAAPSIAGRVAGQLPPARGSPGRGGAASILRAALADSLAVVAPGGKTAALLRLEVAAAGFADGTRARGAAVAAEACDRAANTREPTGGWFYRLIASALN
ncbi:hypothetical protein MNEG_11531 [Monoraphidium neglectum]|uniref:Uncharacterized protein n=1 Tax=Monoraphidium neglectum TaxID=145388 RepID=A0A0D2J9J1_9CHLO|nr:hypothetical protein MNEG_11531 [Monoraphidium neglectum]KIY96432.1 hypothetical protein MNEG_11531 [Monoraphidium neglectum]|eukprot:XP_013895452.1 hypothetical protein MNEG_11531 [Monoraphidium neglectum]